MSIAVVSYSLTGNNETLAVAVAKALVAEHIKISEEKPRNMGAIMLDMLLGRTPRVRPLPGVLRQYDRVIFIAPVWMGKAASPLRAYFKYLRENPRPYAFASLSGGALNNNPKLKDELEQLTGKKPAAFVDFHIADLLPPNPKPTAKNTGDYRINEKDTVKLAGMIVDSIKHAMGI